MMRGTDYTRMNEGTPVEDGEIKKCPHCGRLGLARMNDGRVVYTHKQGIDAVTNQGFFDWCPDPSRSLSK
jgi:hypothetical protein